jgi:protocatechuate 3,4-dioxygenase beta subunit
VIKGWVWQDTNGDGAYQPREGCGGVNVNLATMAGARRTRAEWQTVTDASGYYRFEGLAGGAYRLTFEDPQGRLPRTTRVVQAENLAEEGVVLDLVYRAVHVPMLLR